MRRGKKKKSTKTRINYLDFFSPKEEEEEEEKRLTLHFERDGEEGEGSELEVEE